MVEHVGHIPSNGHYLAYKKFLSRWVFANDEHIEFITDA
jgi:ubiquitin C-terminal hydrolase